MQNTDYAQLYQAIEHRCAGTAGFLLTCGAFERAFSEGVARVERAPPAARAVATGIPEVSFTATLRRDATFAATIEPDGGSCLVRLTGVTMRVDLHRSAKAADVLTSIDFVVQAVTARLVVRQGGIVAIRRDHQIDAQFAAPPPTRAQAIVDLGWSATEVGTFERFEDFVAFASPSSIADQLLGMLGPLPLDRWLVGLSLGDPLAIEFLDQPPVGPSVLVRPRSTSTLRRPEACLCAEIKHGEDTAATTGSLATGNLALAITSGPRASAPDAAQEAPSGAGFAGHAFLLLPRTTLAAAFSPAIYPAIHIGDGGGWGSAQYSWSAVVTFKAIAVALDPGTASLLLTTDLGVYAEGRAWVNLPCDGEKELAQGNVSGEINNLAIRIRLTFDRTTKQLVLDSTLENHDVSALNVRLHSLVLPWPLDEILGAVLAHNAPGLISEQLRTAVASGRFTLLDLQQLFGQPNALMPANAQVSYMEANGLLVGIGYWG